MKGATKDPEMSSGKQDISILAPDEGSDRTHKRRPLYGYISILAPDEGSDGGEENTEEIDTAISILAPDEGSDLK